MQVAIELLIIFVLIGMLIVWAVWKRLTDWINLKRYDESKDKSRIGEERRKELIAEAVAGTGIANTETREPIVETSTDAVPRPSEPSERSLLQAATSDSSAEPERDNGKEQSVPGEASDSVGKGTSRGFFSRFKRGK